MNEKSIIIIDAGIAGLSTGCYGQMNGYRTQIFEMHDELGGCCTSWKRDGYTIDGCFHYLTGSGMIVGSALLGLWGGFSRKILTSLVGLMGMGAGTLILALVPSSAIFLAVGGALLVSLMTPVTMGPFFAVLQSTVEPDMQARIFSLLTSVGTGITPLGLMIAGPVADRVGIQTWFILGGILCLCMGLAGLFIPAVMNIETKGGTLLEPINAKQTI